MGNVVKNAAISTRLVCEKNDPAGALVLTRMFNNTHRSYTRINGMAFEYLNFETEEAYESDVTTETTKLIYYFWYHINYNPYLNYYFQFRNSSSGGVTDDTVLKLYWHGTLLLTCTIAYNDNTQYYWQGSLYIPDYDAYTGGLITATNISLSMANDPPNQVAEIKRLRFSSSNQSLLTTVTKGTVA